MEYSMEKEAALVEAILFLESEPIDAASIVRITGFSKELVDEVLKKLQERHSNEMHGIELIQISGGWTFSPKEEFWENLKERYGRKNENRLSRAAMETLSIIAYSQPITRAEIEAIRGVSADNMIRLLSEKNLIKEVGKKDIPGKPVQFGTTKEFLKVFRLNSISDLPKLDETESDRFELAR
ncbi:SMC-Scp complex subunit ScpB [Brucepastera parasyntrophica]|uniref:SMC-Scp complex subunit ScpB n=1 Tax=Brucepastera parasyntrophica TaxID=2880008 RepID=UPI00210C7C84|nr:SMC-Scp complex subunit ScpB [Brucepastera parasyntrophica]ULQ59901.1 SMC-Scp complex subunit ScpB [Brucepastera parasyntrophica]